MFQGKHPWGNTKPFSVEPFGRRPFSRAPVDAILHWDASKNKPLLPVTYNGKYLVVKNV